MAVSNDDELTDIDLDQPPSVSRSRSTEDHEDENDQLQGCITFKSNSNISTKRQTKYGLSVFKDFIKRENKNLEDIDDKALDGLLSNFYKAARNKKGELYSVKSMQAIRFGLQRYFLESRGLDIIRRDEFVLSHRTFKAMLLKLKVHGKGKIRHHPPITEDDMERMQASLDLSTPQGLQHKVFLDTMLYFGRSGMKNLRSTRPGDFVPHQKNGQIFYTLGENQKAKMHAMPGSPRCPVANLQKYISKLNIKCEWMWQRPKHHCPEDHFIWYTDSALGRTTLSLMTKTISESAGCYKGYTTHSLRTSMTKEMLETLSANTSTNTNNSRDGNYAITVITLPATSNSIAAQVNRVDSARLLNSATTAANNTTTTTGIPRTVNESQSITGSSSNRAIQPIQPYTRKHDNSVPSNKAVNKGTMTDLTWIELPRKLVQSKDACTQWKKHLKLEPLSFHSATCSTSSSEQNCLCQYPQNTPAVEKDECVGSDESSSVDSPDVSSSEAGSKDGIEEVNCNLCKEGVPSSAPFMRRIKEEIIDEPQEVPEDNYQTIYIKEENVEDDCQEDDHASIQATAQQSLNKDGHSRMQMNSSRSTQPTPGGRAPRQDEEFLIGSKKMYRLKFLVSWENTKQILTIDSPTDTVTVATIKKAVCHRLQGLDGGLSMQYFDEFWQDWVDIEPSMTLRGRMRLKVILTSGRVESRHQASTPDGQQAHRLKYHVTLGHSKQVLIVNSPNDTASGAAVMEAVSSMLQGVVNRLLLQYFDEGWQEWIDVEPSMVLGGRMRLRVMQESRKLQPDPYC